MAFAWNGTPLLLVFLQYTNLVTICSSSPFCLFGKSAEFVFHFCFYFFTGGYVFVESLYSATTLWSTTSRKCSAKVFSKSCDLPWENNCWRNFQLIRTKCLLKKEWWSLLISQGKLFIEFKCEVTQVKLLSFSPLAQSLTKLLDSLSYSSPACMAKY